MIHVTRKDRESAASLIRRFSKRIQQTGIVLQARKVQFFRKEKSKGQRRESALRREAVRQERETLWKLGKLDEEER